MVDFGKLRKDKTKSVHTEPMEVFRRLPKNSGINDLWNSQAMALKEWYERKNEKDLVIKLNTGGGKTLVGLLVLQSIMNQTKGSTLYLCPDTQLVDQVYQKAKEYGIPAVTYERGQDLNDNFLVGSHIMIATYSALFNGRSKFGVLGRSQEIIRVEGIVVDDAHTAFTKIRDVFSIVIDTKDKNDIYSELTGMFRNDFASLGKQGTFDDIIDGRDFGVLEVPYWSWKDRAKEVRKIISNSQESFIFEWPLIRDSFEFCHALISSRDFTITPLYPMVDLFPTFTECPRRIYMSATIADDSSIVRTFDADANSIKLPIAPRSLAGIGERMILAPALMDINSENIEEVIKDICKWISKKSLGVVILAPSDNIAKQWTSIAKFPSGSNELQKAVSQLTSGLLFGPFVFSNRYDGIDLPNNSCRLLILANMPKGANSYDLYRAAVLEGSSSISNTLAQKIEQGLGRGTRGAGDHCVVILTGYDLIAWISRSSNLERLTTSTKAQMEMGLEVSKNVNDEKDLKDTISKCINRDQDWIEYHAETLADMVESDNVDIISIDISAAERRYFRLIRDGYYEKSIASLYAILNKEKVNGIELKDKDKEIKENNKFQIDNKIRGWLFELIARAFYSWGLPDKANEAQMQAYGNNKLLLRPQVATPYTSLVIPGNQAVSIIEYLSKYKVGRGFLAEFEEVSSRLVASASSNQFEEALKELGFILGFKAERPEKEYSFGPDVLWIMNDNIGLVIECKSRRKNKNLFSKDEHGQLLTAFEWFKKEYPNLKGYKISVHPNCLATNSAIADETYALTLDKLSQLVSTTRVLVTDLVNSYVPIDALKSRCESKLYELKLNPNQIIKNYLQPFRVS